MLTFSILILTDLVENPAKNIGNGTVPLMEKQLKEPHDVEPEEKRRYCSM